MTTAIALHTIHRLGKNKTQTLVFPGKGKDSEFECSEKEFADLEKLGAVKRAKRQAPEKIESKKDEKAAAAEKEKAAAAEKEKAAAAEKEKAANGKTDDGLGV